MANQIDPQLQRDVFNFGDFYIDSILSIEEDCEQVIIFIKKALEVWASIDINKDNPKSIEDKKTRIKDILCSMANELSHVHGKYVANGLCEVLVKHAKLRGMISTAEDEKDLAAPLYGKEASL